MHSTRSEVEGCASTSGSATLLLCELGHAAWPVNFNFYKTGIIFPYREVVRVR